MRFDERNGSSVLDRGFRLLQAFGPEESQLALSELARRANLPKATAFRLANQLLGLGVLERKGEAYRLGMRLFEIGSIVPRQRRLRDAALPFMEDLYEAAHETIHLGVLDGFEVLYIDKIAGRRSSGVDTHVGTRKPLYCTALGKVIMAYSKPRLMRTVLKTKLVRYTPYTIISGERLAQELALAAKTGVAYDREEYKLGISCVASPLTDQSGQAVGALSITGPTDRFPPDRFAAAVRTAALGVSRALNGSAPS
jgi:DNA-binding IclR family transcriptional regulator